VLIPSDYGGRSGIRGMGGQMRTRIEQRQAIRRGEWGAPEEPPPEPAQAAPAPTDALSGTWTGTLLGPMAPEGFPWELTLALAADGTVSGSLSLPGYHDGPIVVKTWDAEALTLVFDWTHPARTTTYTLTFGGEELRGTAPSSTDTQGYTVTAKRGQARPAPRRREPAYDPVLALVLDASPAGFISSSKDERVWTTSAPGWRDTAPDDMPRDVEVTVRERDYDFMAARLAEGLEIEAEFDLSATFEPGPIPCYNTIAEIPGTTHPDEVVIVSAHLDSWNGPGSQGTTDNGTGSAVVMEAARLLMAADARPHRTIRFILWTGEEQGLLGSARYLESLSEEERARISAVFVDDGGTNYQGGLVCIESMRDYLAAATAPINGRFFSPHDARARPDDPGAGRLNVNIRTADNMPRGGGSDHATFNRAGIPGFFWDEVGRADYGRGWHTQYDRIDLAIPEYLAQSATCMAVTAYNLACAPGLLPRAAPRTETPAGE
jgi:hypothetical protein